MARTKDTGAAGPPSKATKTGGNESSNENQSIFKDSADENDNDGEEEDEDEGDNEEDKELEQPHPVPRPRFDPGNWPDMTRGMFFLF